MWEDQGWNEGPEAGWIWIRGDRDSRVSQNLSYREKWRAPKRSPLDVLNPRLIREDTTSSSEGPDLVDFQQTTTSKHVHKPPPKNTFPSEVSTSPPPPPPSLFQRSKALKPSKKTPKGPKPSKMEVDDESDESDQNENEKEKEASEDEIDLTAFQWSKHTDSLRSRSRMSSSIGDTDSVMSSRKSSRRLEKSEFIRKMKKQKRKEGTYRRRKKGIVTNRYVPRRFGRYMEPIPRT